MFWGACTESLKIEFFLMKWKETRCWLILENANYRCHGRYTLIMIITCILTLPVLGDSFLLLMWFLFYIILLSIDEQFGMQIRLSREAPFCLQGSWFWDFSFIKVFPRWSWLKTGYGDNRMNCPWPQYVESICQTFYFVLSESWLILYLVCWTSCYPSLIDCSFCQSLMETSWFIVRSMVLCRKS